MSNRDSIHRLRSKTTLRAPITEPRSLMFDRQRRTFFVALLVTVGVAFAVAGLTLWFVLIRPQTTALNQAVLGIIVHVLFGYVVMMAGVSIARNKFSIHQCVTAVKWCFGGAAFMGLLAVWRALPELRAGANLLGILNELVLIGSVGAAAGVLVGLNRGQAIRNRELVSQKETREETLVFLLRLLDHDIGNHLFAISNHARSIRPSTFDPSPTPSEAIEERAANIERLLETANVVLESETGDTSFDRVDLSSVIREQANIVRADVPDVDLCVELTDELYVECDRFVGDVFRNLLENAVVHNPSDDLTVTVTGSVVDDAVEVAIEDDGVGIPDDVREDLFDPGVRGDVSPGDGIGLYLVRKFVKSYDGSISMSDRSPNGTRFQLRFPRAAIDNSSS
ncbi:sensor histidine kinase [Natronomonas salsuginis]|uniref:histidine kinase n=1 Tax=Natronomonas salsuginis TaxID=2217661 RepID=A0A4U5JIB4_9EURY|nr:HAMP domain-containing sensor histidine kinase [Natronomonas salsuginis]TKR27798.1 HAMP domain-containing histidine kinase [Natronomonas salsuginis]